MPDKDLDMSFGFVLNDIARLMRKRFDQRARGLGLTRAQWRVLAHLARHEGINQAGLAEILEIEPITVGRLIDRMEEAGWVERRPKPNDRRVRLLYLTDKAWPVFARMRAIGAAERDRLIAMLVTVRSNLSDRGGSAPEEPAVASARR
jgi:DNA-binding MarR family transcriptional regulator